jgi:Hint module
MTAFISEQCTGKGYDISFVSGYCFKNSYAFQYLTMTGYPLTTGLSAPTTKPVFALPTRPVTAAPVLARVSTALPTYAAVDGIAPLTPAAPFQPATIPTITAPTSQQAGVPTLLPTAAPTQSAIAPTITAPTSQQAGVPTLLPTAAPTQSAIAPTITAPTSQQAGVPTLLPTAAPTQSAIAPTITAPTSQQAGVPTLLPTAAPTQSAIAPTITAPTSQETGVPSFVVIIRSPTVQQAANAPESQSANTCFAGSERVTLESGRSKFLSDVRVGDNVMVADAAGKTSFSQVRGGEVERSVDCRIR